MDGNLWEDESYDFQGTNLGIGWVKTIDLGHAWQ